MPSPWRRNDKQRVAGKWKNYGNSFIFASLSESPGGFQHTVSFIPSVPLDTCFFVSPSLCPHHQPVLLKVSTPHPTATSGAVPWQANPIHVLHGTGAFSPLYCAGGDLLSCAAPEVSRTRSEVVKPSWYQTPLRRAWRSR